MKAIATLSSLAVAVALGAVLHGQQARDRALTQRAAGTATITGTVVTDEQTPQPVRNATVTAMNVEGTGSRTTATDEAGRFGFAGLAAGRYTLTATKAPFLRASYGASRPDLPGTTITVKDAGQLTGLTLRMTRGAVITGRIVDENGEPVFGVMVRAVQARMQAGERTFGPPASGTSIDTTDDRGVYRLFGLPAGEYVVSATPRLAAGEIRAMTEDEIRATMQALQQQQAARVAAQSMAGGNASQTPTPTPTPIPMPDVEKVTVAYAPVYYPGTTVAATASTLTIGAGEERSGVEFALQVVRTATVEGMVIVPQGIAPQSVQLMMTPAAQPGTGLAGLEQLALQRVVPGPDGKFTYTAVAPGQYTISARAVRSAGGQPAAQAGRAGGQGVMTFNARVAGGSGDDVVMPVMIGPGGDPDSTQFWAQADVLVDGTPVSGVALTLQPGMTISGKVEFRSLNARPGADFTKVQLNLAPVATGALRVTMGAPSTKIDETGQFTIAGVTPGRYRIAGSAPSAPMPGSAPAAPWRIASAVIKGRDILDFPLDVGPGDDISDAVVTFTDATQEITGTLQDASGRPAPDYTIVVFASDNRYWTPQSRRIRSVRPSTDGRFTIAGLPPGEYRMAAVVDLAPGEVSDPAFLEQLIPASFVITLGAGEKKTQDLRIAGGL
jgi:protocatechuate 3,4-dioxygenase beta subunit